MFPFCFHMNQNEPCKLDLGDFLSLVFVIFFLVELGPEVG